MSDEYKTYRKKLLQPMKPYTLGDSLERVSISEEDTLETGGMIAVNPNNHDDKWYVGKAFFEANYEEVEAVLPSFQQRVIDERLELDTKLSKLTGFLNSDTSYNVPEEELRRLTSQQGLMQSYSELLAERIANF